MSVSVCRGRMVRIDMRVRIDQHERVESIEELLPQESGHKAGVLWVGERHRPVPERTILDQQKLLQHIPSDENCELLRSERASRSLQHVCTQARSDKLNLD